MASCALPERAKAVLSYWFDEKFPNWPRDVLDQPPGEGLKKWFGGGPAVDEFIRKEFMDDVEAMGKGERDDWLKEPLPALAGLVLMDQFSRNVYRGTAQMYSLDGKALEWAGALASNEAYTSFHPAFKFFVALPYMHSEVLEDQQMCIDILSKEVDSLKGEFGEDCPAVKALENCVQYGRAHKDVIVKWGRFPHRNAILGRESTQEEAQGMEDGSIKSF